MSKKKVKQEQESSDHKYTLAVYFYIIDSIGEVCEKLDPTQYTTPLKLLLHTFLWSNIHEFEEFYFETFKENKEILEMIRFFEKVLADKYTPFYKFIKKILEIMINKKN